jgi:hypothetical protein
MFNSYKINKDRIRNQTCLIWKFFYPIVDKSQSLQFLRLTRVPNIEILAIKP